MEMDNQSVILAIETANRACSVALLSAEEVLFEEANFDPSHSNSALVGGYCQKALALAQKEGLTPVAVAVTAGPGSYTGLRIGASVAKGLALGLSLPLIAIPTMQGLLFASPLTETAPREARFCVLQQASKDDVYTQTFERAGLPITSPQAVVPSADWLRAVQETNAAHPLYFVGDALAMMPQSIEPQYLCPVTELRAAHFRTPAWQKLRANQTEDVAYWVPEYVKPYKVLISKNKILNR